MMSLVANALQQHVCISFLDGAVEVVEVLKELTGHWHVIV